MRFGLQIELKPKRLVPSAPDTITTIAHFWKTPTPECSLLPAVSPVWENRPGGSSNREQIVRSEGWFTQGEGALA
jgi:hypothetical protein